MIRSRQSQPSDALDRWNGERVGCNAQAMTSWPQQSTCSSFCRPWRRPKKGGVESHVRPCHRPDSSPEPSNVSIPASNGSASARTRPFESSPSPHPGRRSNNSFDEHRSTHTYLLTLTTTPDTWYVSQAAYNTNSIRRFSNETNCKPSAPLSSMLGDICVYREPHHSDTTKWRWDVIMESGTAMVL